MPDIEVQPNAKNELTLALVREQAIKEYFDHKNQPVQLTGTAQQTGTGLRVETASANGGAQSMVIGGDEGQPGYRFPVSLGVSGDFTVTRNGAQPEQIHFDRSASYLDAGFGRTDIFTMQMIRGKDKMQFYTPAIAEPQQKNGVALLDANLQPIYLSRSPGWTESNCKAENIYNINNKRTECDFFVSGIGSNPLSYNETRGPVTPTGYYRHSVLRDKDRVLAIVDEHFNTDANGLIRSFDVHVRAPQAPKPSS